MGYLEDIKGFTPLCEQETVDRLLMLEAAERLGDGILVRDSALMHMTASSMIINSEHTRVLMAYHNIYASWAWTGGHADGNGNLLEVALKEAKEETGIAHIRPLWEAPVSLEILTVKSHVKRGRYVPSHLHLNVTYALWGDEGDAVEVKPDENARVGWLDIDTLHDFVAERDMHGIYDKIISRMR